MKGDILLVRMDENAEPQNLSIAEYNAYKKIKNAKPDVKEKSLDDIVDEGSSGEEDVEEDDSSEDAEEESSREEEDDDSGVEGEQEGFIHLKRLVGSIKCRHLSILASEPVDANKD